MSARGILHRLGVKPDHDYSTPAQVAARRAPHVGVCIDEDCALSGGYAHVGPCEPCSCGKAAPHAYGEAMSTKPNKSENQPAARLSDDARVLAFYRKQVVSALVCATDAKDIGAMSRAYEALYHVSTGLPLPPAPLSVWWYARSDTHVSDEPGGHWDIVGLTDGGEDWRRYRGRLVTRTQMDEALQEFRASNRGVGARLVRVEVYEDGSERES